MTVLQFISLPYIAKISGSETYGEITFLISIFTLIALPLGNVLNNVRLLENKKYQENNVEGDFNYLLINSIVFASFSFIVISTQIEFLNFKNIILLLFIIFLTILKEYFIVSFRLELNFKGIMLHNLFLSMGFIVGTYIFKLTGFWEYIYIIGLIFGNIYIFKNTKLVNEGFNRTKFFKRTLTNNIYLYIASLLKNFINQADKLLLLPLLGPSSVAIYYSSSILGKMISMFVGPMNSVVLSYLVKENEKKSLGKYLIISIILSIPFYIGVLVIAPYFLNYFYADWAIESIALLKITAATAIITAISSLLHPFNLRFNKLSAQLYINGLYLCVYLLLAFYLSSLHGLFGFSLAVLIANIFNLFFQIFIYYFIKESK